MRRSTLLALGVLVTAGVAAPVAAQSGVTVDWFVGTWSDRADCSARVHFFPDGRYFTQQGGEGRWRLEGRDVILSAPDGSAVRRMTVERIDRNRLRAGQVVSYRCEGRSAPSAG
jgi:hypothetical protein